MHIILNPVKVGSLETTCFSRLTARSEYNSDALVKPKMLTVNFTVTCMRNSSGLTKIFECVTPRLISKVRQVFNGRNNVRLIRV